MVVEDGFIEGTCYRVASLLVDGEIVSRLNSILATKVSCHVAATLARVVVLTFFFSFDSWDRYIYAFQKSGRHGRLNVVLSWLCLWILRTHHVMFALYWCAKNIGEM